MAPGGTGIRRRRRGGFLAVATLVITAMVAVLCAPQAQADDPPPTVDINLRSAFGETTTVTVTLVPATGQIINLNGIKPIEVPNQCFALQGGSQTCLGSTGPARIEGEATTDRFFIRSDAHAALGWIAEEGEQVVAALYDLPADDRVEQYARDQLRSYVHERLLDILDRAAYGLPLTADEQKALAFLQNEVLTADRRLAQAAADEYARFKNEGCAYVPPPAPSYVTDPLPVPASVQSGCRGAIGFSSVFSPPTPSVENFQTWGLYRVASELGLDALGHPQVQDDLRAMTRAGVLTAGLVSAGGSAALTTALVGTNSALATTITKVLAANSTSLLAGGKFAIGFGASAAGALVGVIVFAVVAAALAIWQLVEAEQVGATLNKRLAAAHATTDPFGLAQLQAANAGRDLDADRQSWNDEGDLPFYRKEAASNRLSELVVRWTTVRPNGVVRPDPTGIWPDNATTPDDHRFRVTDEGGDVRLVDEIAVRTPGGGSATARFDDGWLVVTPAGGTSQATVTLEYVTGDGATAHASRQPEPGGGGQRFAVTRLDGQLVPTSTVEDAITYRTPSGEVETAEVVTPPEEAPSGARPTVTGPLLPDRIHHLRPNALNADGEIDDAAFLGEFDVVWLVERYDEATGEWVADTPVDAETVDGNPTYGGRFVPSHAGRYRAQATLVHRHGAAPEVSGTVEFTVLPPDIELLTLDVIDDHLGDELEVRVRVSEQVPSDDLTVEVAWPGEIGSDAPGPVSQAAASCTGGTPCATGLVTLTQPIDALTDLRGDVTVTVTNSHGAQLTRVVPVANPARPSLTQPPVPPGDDQPGVVTFEEHRVHLQLPVGIEGDPNYVVAGIEPGQDPDPAPTFMLTDVNGDSGTGGAIDLRDGDGTFMASIGERDGQRVLVVRGVPRFDDLGSFEVPVVVRQSNGATRTVVLLIDVVPAPDDRYRAGLVSEVDPLDFVEDGPPAAEVRLLGGKAEWGTYDGEVCISLHEDWTSSQHCDAASEFFESDGTPRPFPYHELAPHGLSASGGVKTIRAWLPEGERTFAAPMRVAFMLLPGTNPPSITDLRWDADAGVATLEVEPSSPDVPIERVTCTLDGSPVEPCFAAEGGTWAPPLLTPGEHELEVLVVDAKDNYDTASVVLDPGEPIVLPGGGSVLEGDEGAVLRVGATLSHPVAHEVTVEWTTLHVGGLIFDEGTPGDDYEPASGTLTFAPGQVSAEVEIPVHDDDAVENDELVVVSFRSPAGARLGGFFGLGFGVIVDDEWPKAVPGQAAVTEGEEPVVVSVPVTLSQPSDEEVTLSWRTVPVGGLDVAEAEPGEDYEAASGTVTFAPGQTEATVEITVLPDDDDEPDEVVIVQFHSPVGARLGGFWGLGVALIRDRA